MKRLPLSVAIFLVCLGVSHSECPQGWFGSRCQYKCHCTEDKCEPLDGNCLDDAQCLLGWFGPACQYVDLARDDKIIIRDSDVHLATDANDMTCMNSEGLFLRLRVPLRLSWFRVHVKDPNYLNKLKMEFRQRNSSSLLACEKNRTALVSDTALDIHCGLDVEVTEVYLTGETLQSLCSIYISGGRNVALKQKTAQSSILDNSSWGFKAVDGDTYALGTCTHTDPFDKKPTWNVTFSHPAAINRYVIYNRKTGEPSYNLLDKRLQGFILRSYDPAGAEVFRFTDTAPTVQAVYTVTSVATQIQTVNIRAVKPEIFGNIVLTLCEVEVYGDASGKLLQSLPTVGKLAIWDSGTASGRLHH